MRDDRQEGTSSNGGLAGGRIAPARATRPLRYLVAAAAFAAGVLPLFAPHAASAATPTPQPQTSAIGQQDVTFIAVSPRYEHTGLVVAMGATMSNQCGNNCEHLWVSHDGGAHWAIAAATGWNQGRPVIAADSKGQEAIYAVGQNSTVRSTDGGATWQNVGAGGLSVTPVSTYANNHAVAVTATPKNDYLISDSGTHHVDGSSGANTDFAFAFSPSFPSGGAHHPALLAAIDPATHIPFVQPCDASLQCTGRVALPGATNQSAPATVFTSPHYQDDGIAFVQSAQGIYKSTDGGDTFVPVTIAPASGASATATPAVVFAPGFDGRGPNRTAYAAVLQVFEDPKSPHTAGGVYRSDDGGGTWTADSGDSLVNGGATTVAVAPDGRLFAGYLRLVGGVTAAGMLCSADGGASWQAFCSPVGDVHTAGAQNVAPAPSGPCFGAGCASTPAATAGSTPAAAGNNAKASNTSPGDGHPVGANLTKPASGSSRMLIVGGALLLAVVLGVAALLRRRLTGGTVRAPS